MSKPPLTIVRNPLDPALNLRQPSGRQAPHKRGTARETVIRSHRAPPFVPTRMK